MFCQSQLLSLPQNTRMVVNNELCLIHRKTLKYFNPYFQNLMCETCFNQQQNYPNDIQKMHQQTLDFNYDDNIKHARDHDNKQNLKIAQKYEDLDSFKTDKQQENCYQYQNAKSINQKKQHNRKRRQYEQILSENDQQFNKQKQKQDKRKQNLNSYFGDTKKQGQLDYIDELRKKVQRELDISDGNKGTNKNIAEKIFDLDFNQYLEQQQLKENSQNNFNQQFQQYPNYLNSKLQNPLFYSQQSLINQQLPIYMQQLNLFCQQSYQQNFPCQYYQQTQLSLNHQITKQAKIKYISQNNNQINNKEKIVNLTSQSIQTSQPLQTDSRQLQIKIENDISDQTTNYSELKNHSFEEIIFHKDQKNILSVQTLNNIKKTTKLNEKTLNQIDQQVISSEQNNCPLNNKQNKNCINQNQKLLELQNSTLQTGNKNKQSSQQISI